MFRQLTALLFLLATFLPTAVGADPMSVYGSAEETRDGVGGFTLRGGAGSLFGPAFDAGQPEYAHSDGFDWGNRRPFSAARQTAMTFGLATSLTLGIGKWAVGPTVAAGFNAAHRTSDSFSNIQLESSLTGLTFGGGLRLTRGAGPVRFTLDAVGSHSVLRGQVDWSYSDFSGSDTLVGNGQWEVAFIRFAAMAGVEIEFSPIFVFLDAGAQFLPRQEREHRITGSFPEAHTSDPSHVKVIAQVENRGRATVTIHQELSFAASAGIGVRF